MAPENKFLEELLNEMLDKDPFVIRTYSDKEKAQTYVKTYERAEHLAFTHIEQNKKLKKKGKDK